MKHDMVRYIDTRKNAIQRIIQEKKIAILRIRACISAEIPSKQNATKLQVLTHQSRRYGSTKFSNAS
jgi:hypothetical protein